MKYFVLLLMVALAVAVGYLMGTEDGRQRRDDLIAKLRKEAASAAEEAAEAAEDAADAVAEAVA